MRFRILISIFVTAVFIVPLFTIGPVEAYTETISLLGDKDGFGLGLNVGDVVPAPANFDARESDDPLFTDVWPAAGWPSYLFSYSHSYVLPYGEIVDAKFTWITKGIQDGDNQVVGSDVDIRLFIDDAEVPGAFDEVDQFDYFSGIGWSEVVGIVNLAIPSNLLPLLSDGNAEIRFEVYALGTYQGRDGFAVDFSELFIKTDDVIPVVIDIKPGSYPNSVNLRSAGVIPVAILTTEDFDATTVDPLTVVFGTGGAMESHEKGHIKDVDEDGDLDLVLHFRVKEAGIECGDVEALLAGETFSGQDFMASDDISTLGCE